MTAALLRGISEALDGIQAAEGTPGVFSWRPDGSPYPDDVIGIFFDTAPDGGPSLTINDYGVDDDPVTTDSTVGVQFRFRAEPGLRLVRPMRDTVFDLFHGMSAVTLGGVRVTGVARTSSTKLGQTASGLMDWSDNYYFRVHRPGTHRY